jgi:hypothetical protein
MYLYMDIEENIVFPFSGIESLFSNFHPVELGLGNYLYIYIHIYIYIYTGCPTS